LRARRAAALFGVQGELPPRQSLRAGDRHALRAHRASGQSPRPDQRMDAQPAMGSARPRGARGVRHRAAVPGFARAATCDRGLPWPAGEREFRAGALGGARRGQAWTNSDGIRLSHCAQKPGGRAIDRDLGREQTMETTMLSPDRVYDHEPLSPAAADYDVVRRAIAFVSERW